MRNGDAQSGTANAIRQKNSVEDPRERSRTTLRAAGSFGRALRFRVRLPLRGPVNSLRCETRAFRSSRSRTGFGAVDARFSSLFDLKILKALTVRSQMDGWLLGGYPSTLSSRTEGFSGRVESMVSTPISAVKRLSEKASPDQQIPHCCDMFLFRQEFVEKYSRTYSSTVDEQILQLIQRIVTHQHLQRPRIACVAFFCFLGFKRVHGRNTGRRQLRRRRGAESHAIAEGTAKPSPPPLSKSPKPPPRRRLK